MYLGLLLRAMEHPLHGHGTVLGRGQRQHRPALPGGCALEVAARVSNLISFLFHILEELHGTGCTESVHRSDRLVVNGPVRENICIEPTCSALDFLILRHTTRTSAGSEIALRCRCQNRRHHVLGRLSHRILARRRANEISAWIFDLICLFLYVFEQLESPPSAQTEHRCHSLARNGTVLEDVGAQPGCSSMDFSFINSLRDSRWRSCLPRYSCLEVIAWGLDLLSLLLKIL
mmetsp:Transcript_51979/g.116620  ORF Transcript_51979/g.116620 Transcript_51979/m.116620 type:complete len:232 (-) Transcript_51979:150-845(-)